MPSANEAAAQSECRRHSHKQLIALVHLGTHDLSAMQDHVYRRTGALIIVGTGHRSTRLRFTSNGQLPSLNAYKKNHVPFQIAIFVCPNIFLPKFRRLTRTVSAKDV